MDGIIEEKAGAIGRIGCYYPVDLLIFDLSIEVPVCDLFGKDVVIGIRWCDLTFV